MPVKHPVSNILSKEGLTHPLVRIYWPDIRAVHVEERDLIIPIFTSLSISISRAISHCSFLLSVNSTSPSLHIAHTTHQVLLLSPLLMVINYKVSRQFITPCTGGEKKYDHIRPDMWICGTRHSTVVDITHLLKTLSSCYCRVAVL
jgi:hypothetical protein